MVARAGRRKGQAPIHTDTGKGRSSRGVGAGAAARCGRASLGEEKRALRRGEVRKERHELVQVLSCTDVALPAPQEIARGPVFVLEGTTVYFFVYGFGVSVR